VASTSPLVDLSHPLDFVDHRVKVNKVDALTSNSYAFFAKELYNLLINLKAASLHSQEDC
jgi:hypothetical protein